MAEMIIRRHPAWVRLTHWMNALCLALLAMSGMQIFNAHPVYISGCNPISPGRCCRSGMGSRTG